jgi:hypothetical protein
VERWGAWPYLRPDVDEAVLKIEAEWNDQLGKTYIPGGRITIGNRALRRKKIRDLQAVTRKLRIASAALREWEKRH